MGWLGRSRLGCVGPEGCVSLEELSTSDLHHPLAQQCLQGPFCSGVPGSRLPNHPQNHGRELQDSTPLLSSRVPISPLPRSGLSDFLSLSVLCACCAPSSQVSSCLPLCPLLFLPSRPFCLGWRLRAAGTLTFSPTKGADAVARRVPGLSREGPGPVLGGSQACPGQAQAPCPAV